jgi:hypothetical protein
MKHPGRGSARSWTLAGLAVVFAGLQLVPVEKNNPPVRQEVDAPPPVMEILRRACYDCHSNETRWPWYSRVAPSSWFVSTHVRKGRGDLNFSDWPIYDFEQQQLNLDDIQKQIEKGKMPLRSYLLLHPEARLSETDRSTLLDWSGGS